MLVAAIDQELAGQSVAKIPAELGQSLERLLKNDPIPTALVRLGLRLGHPRAYARAIAIINDRKAPEAERLQMIQTLGETSGNAASGDLFKLLDENPSLAIATSILTALERSDHSEIPGEILKLYPKLSEPLKEQACDLLCSRKNWALALLKVIDKEELPRSTLSMTQLRRIQRHHDADIDSLLEKNWGKIREVSNAEVQERRRCVDQIDRVDAGVAANGKAVFVSNCGKCHQFLGLGTAIGPT